MHWRACVLATLFLIPAQARPDDDLALAAKSPYDLEHFFETHPAFETAPLWEALDVHEEAMPLPECTDSLHALRACSSELMIVTEPYQAIVVLSQRETLFSVCLRFLRVPRSDDQWAFGGFFAPYVKYFPSTHDVLMFGDTPYLLVTGQGQAGTGVSSAIEYWFDLREPRMHPCFSHTLHGDWNLLPGSMTAHVEGFLSTLKTEPVETITISYQADFGPSVDDQTAAFPRDEVVFTRQHDGTFTFDPALSTTTTKAIHELYEDLYDLSPDDFLRYNLADLKSDMEFPQIRAWLASYLKTCTNTPERRELLHSIRNRRQRVQ
jgi:hypothetical protein